MKITSLLLAAAVFGLAACSSLKAPPEANLAARSAYDTSPTLPNAVKVAESWRDAYMARSADLRLEERYNGLALIGLGVVGANLVARGVGENSVLGLGLGGIGLYTANNWANPRSERLIYAEAAAALQCAINLIEPLRPAYEQMAELQTHKDALTRLVPILEAKLKGLEGSQDPRVVQATNALTKARAAITAAEAALGYLKAAGPSLARAVGDMRVDAEVQLTRGSPDYGTLVSSLIQQKVLPAVAPLSVPGKEALKLSGPADELVGPTAQVEAEIAAIDQIVAMANVRPSAADLQRCRVDPKEAGIAMKVQPSMLSLKAGERTVALASGGKEPYTIVPLVDTVTAEQLIIGVASSGIVTVEAKSEAKLGTYTVYVNDAGKGHETLIITVTAAASPSAAANGNKTTPTSATTACTTPNAAVKELQDELRTLGFTKVKVDNADMELVVDGCQGKVTNSAMKQFYLGQGLAEADIEKDPAKLLTQAIPDVKTAVAKKLAAAH